MSIYTEGPSEQQPGFSDIFHSALEKVFDGSSGVWRATILPFVLLTILETIILSSALSPATITQVLLAFGLLIFVWLLSAHMFFTYLRIFTFGEAYATPWSAVPDSYSDEHRGRLRRAFGVFVLYSLVLGLPSFALYRVFNGFEDLLFEVLDSTVLIIAVYAPFALALNFVNFVILAVFSGVWMNRAIGALSDGFWQNIISSVQKFGDAEQAGTARKYAVAFAILLFVPDLIIFVLLATDVTYSISEIGFLGILIISVMAAFFRVWSIVLYAGFASKVYGLLYQDPTESDLEDAILTGEQPIAKSPQTKGGSFVSLADDDAEEKAKQAKAAKEKEKKAAKSDSLFY